MTALRRILCLVVWLPVSCASDSGKDKSSDTGATPVHKPLSERIEQKNGYKQDASGNWVPLNNQRSTYESKGTSAYFQGKYQKKAYDTKDVATKSWWGTKQYESQKYAGNTDASRYQKDSTLGGKGAREAGTAANLPAAYKTGSYTTNAAREAGHRGVDKPSNSQIGERRKVFPAPEVIDWKEQRSLSVDQSKGILGH